MTDINTNELKQLAPIIPYVKKYYGIQFDKVTKGAVFCKCLWHQENTASLCFFQNGTYKCFGCGEHGDIITFVQKQQNISFQEACKMIGDNVGYEVILENPNPFYEEYKETMSIYKDRYCSNLLNRTDALQYLTEKRGISKEMIQLFQLGMTDIEEYKYRTEGGISNRISFPIFEHKKKNAKPLGFGYRDINGARPKYLNDQNQDGRDGQNSNYSGVFIKGELLYGMNLAFNSIKDTKQVILVEGYFDVIAMHQSKFTNTVGLMGSSITDSLLTFLMKCADKIILLLDNDSAGRNGMLEIIKKAYAIGWNEVVVCLLEDFKDAAEMCQSLQFDSSKIYNEIRNHNQQGISFIINNLVKNYENIVLSERTHILQTVMPILESIKSPSLKKVSEDYLLKKIDIFK